MSPKTPAIKPTDAILPLDTVLWHLSPTEDSIKYFVRPRQHPSSVSMEKSSPERLPLPIFMEAKSPDPAVDMSGCHQPSLFGSPCDLLGREEPPPKESHVYVESWIESVKRDSWTTAWFDRTFN